KQLRSLERAAIDRVIFGRRLSEYQLFVAGFSLLSLELHDFRLWLLYLRRRQCRTLPGQRTAECWFRHAVLLWTLPWLYTLHRSFLTSCQVILSRRSVCCFFRCVSTC